MSLRSYIYTFCFCLVSTLVFAQDDYHSNLINTLSVNYGVNEGTWLFYDNEAEVYNNVGSYGASTTPTMPFDQPFSQAVQLKVAAAGANPWDAGWTIRNRVSVQQQEKILVTFWLRSIGGEGEVNAFAERASDFSKEFYLTLNVAEEWTQYFVPIESTNSYSANQLVVGFHLANKGQTVEIGGFTARKFPAAIPTNQLPNKTGSDQYGGFAPDAPWRAEAANRIDTLRKANLNIRVKNTDASAVADAAVTVKMLQHEFAFGTAITAARIAGNNDQNRIYEDKLINLDGRGHGFNWVVFENDMKWRAWEQNWFVSNAELANAVQWLRNQGIKIRGHNLLWPGRSYLPGDVVDNLNNPGYLRNRINERIETIMNYEGLKGAIEEWDILNEIVTNRDLEFAFRGKDGYTTGREFYREIFEKARKEDSETGFWLNDFVTLSLRSSPGSPNYDNLKAYTRELVEANIGLEGIGFQAHIGGSLNGIPEVLATYDDFYNSFGLKAKVTEYDVDRFVSDELAATYLRDFLTATFSHPSMDGFLMWGFWDGAHWKNNSPLFYRDWKKKPAADTFIDLVFKEWWTEDTLTTDAQGVGTVRGFKGTYEIAYSTSEGIVKDTIQLTGDTVYEIVADNVLTSTSSVPFELEFQLFPNPAVEEVILRRDNVSVANIQIIDQAGRILWRGQSEQKITKIPLELPSGIYRVLVQTDKEQGTTTLVVQQP